MNAMNNSSDEVAECPLCMEPLEVDDLNFYPCTCGYQICRFCWHRIRTDENELCPACRKAYPENPADFTPLTQEQILALKAEKRHRDQQRKQKITENRKHLANVRVVQKNLVFVVGLPPRLADADILKKHEYFGKYGKIHKVVINPSTTYAGVQGPSASAYVTYVNNNDALRAIQSVNNIMIDGRLIKTSLGTTKYCSHFMKNQQCPKTDCMYLHELGDPEASFTKEEMHQCKHQEYEKRLHDALIAASAATPNGAVGGSTGPQTNGSGKVGDGKLTNGTGSVPSPDAWPSLSVSPVNKEPTGNGKTKGGNKENSNKNENGRSKHDKAKNDKKKNQKLQNKENSSNTHHQNQGTKDPTTANTSIPTESNALTTEQVASGKSEKNHRNNKEHKTNHISADEELKYIEYIEKESSSSSGEDNEIGKNAETRSLSSSSSNNSDSTSSLSESTSGKSSPGSFPDHLSTSDTPIINEIPTSNSTAAINEITTEPSSTETTNNGIPTSLSEQIAAPTKLLTNSESNTLIDTTACLSKLNLFDDNNSFFSSSSFQPLFNKGKLDDRTSLNNQINSAISSHLPDLLNGIDSYQNPLTNGNAGSEDWEDAFKVVMMRNTMEEQQNELIRMQELQKRNNILNSMGVGQQPNGLHEFNSSSFHGGATPEMNRISAMLQQQQREQLHQQHQHQQHQNNLHHNENMLGSNLFGSNMSKFFDFHKNQQQQQHQHFMHNGHPNGLMNDHRDHLGMATLLDTNRINSQFPDHSNGLIGQQMQKQRLINKYDQMGSHLLMGQNNTNLTQQQQPPQQPQSRMLNQFPQHSSSVDDDLGFDPFIETQKALAELIENEMVQQQTQTNQNNKHLLENVQRTRMPPPGFNHMNAFGLGVPRAQGSKILPFMNMANNSGLPQQQQQQQQPPLPQPQLPQQNNWNQFGFPPQSHPQSQLNDPQMHIAQQNQNSGNHKNYGSVPDWTAMDPAILSFRQFPSFSTHQQPPQQQPQQQQQHQTPDMFMQHLTQHGVQPNGQGFGHHGVNLPNHLNPQQQNNQQVNYAHTNWLKPESNIYMSNIDIGRFANYNNFENQSMPLPPGISFNNCARNQPKTEC